MRATEKVGSELQRGKGRRIDTGTVDEFTRQTLHDVVRGTLVVDRASQIDRALAAVRSSFGAGSVIEIDDKFARPTSAGYSDVSAKLLVGGRPTRDPVQYPGDDPGEGIGARALRAVARVPGIPLSVRLDLERRQVEIYDRAKSDYTVRTGERL